MDLLKKTISLFPHNEIAYQELLKSLKTYPLALLERATGTGKSFILLKYLYEKMRNKKILFITMHDEMLSQLFNEQMPILGLSKDDFKIFDTLIYPNILKYNMQDIIDKYDCIILDEAHHCGAPKWSKQITELKKLVLNTPNKVMIGATATSIRYLDNYMDVSEIFFDGRRISPLPISLSILKNLLPAPYYIISMKACEERLNKIIKKARKLPKTKEVNTIIERLNKLSTLIKEESSYSHTLKKYDVKPGEKYIVFCRDINDLKRKQLEAQSWFQDIAPIKIYAAHSNQKKEKNKQEITDFSKPRSEISLMFAVDIFNEGFHVDGVNGILMFRKTKSPIIYFQQIGRALSFSARKKQIKIFDFVNNYAENEIISELYKDVILEAKKLINKDKKNKELYLEILNRFQIIDETTKIIDELKQVEEEINEKYIIKNELENAIAKLEEYRLYYPETSFLEELAHNQLSSSYIKAFNTICRMYKNLTIEDIMHLQALNISFNSFINSPINTIISKLNGHQTYKDLQEANFEDFLKRYKLFFKENNRRPNNNSNESSLYNEYRYYLANLSTSKINRLIKSLPIPSTIEELILTNNYPIKEELTKYINYLEYKVINNISLDNVEIKVLKKIKKTLSLKNIWLSSFLTKLDDFNLQIEQAIQTLIDYQKNINPEEHFINAISFYCEPSIYQALTFIHKNAKKITTSQFIKLLSLNMKLPDEINMTLEERQNLLGPYQSLYEKEQRESSRILDEYFNFIKRYNYRPIKTNNQYEFELDLNYNNYLHKSSFVKLREICHTLKSLNVQLTFYEAILTGEPYDQNIILDFIKQIKNNLHTKETISSEDLKLLRAINRFNYLESNEEVEYLIKQITTINKLNQLIERLKNKKESLNSIMYQIRDKKKFLTKKQYQELISLGVTIPEEQISYLEEHNALNTYEIEYLSYRNFIKEYFMYLNNFKNRPTTDNIYLQYRYYLATLSKNKLLKFIQKIASLGYQLTIEELIIINKEVSEEVVEKYVEDINNKIKTKQPIDALNKKILNIIKKQYLTLETQKQVFPSPKTTTKTLESRLINYLRKQISLNPDKPLDFDNSIYQLSTHDLESLEKERINILCKRLFESIINRQKQHKKELTDILSVEELDSFKKYSTSTSLFPEQSYLLAQILSNESYIRLIVKEEERKQFIAEYTTFIISHDGLHPSLSSPIEEERKLAMLYEDYKNYLKPSEFNLITKSIKDSTTCEMQASFYTDFCSFIIENGRFPCGNSDNPYEVKLNKLYATFSRNLNKEQYENIKKLKTKYRDATLLANLSFSKKKK